VASKSTTDQAVWEIQQDLEKQKNSFQEQAKYLEAKRLEERTLYDLEMIKEIGFCNGIENYSRYFDQAETWGTSLLPAWITSPMTSCLWWMKAT